MEFQLWYLFAVVEVALQLSVAVHVIMRGPRQSSTTLAWILVVIVLPVIGVIGWFTLGRARLGAKRGLRHRELSDRITELAGELGPIEEYRDVPAGHETIISIAEAMGALPPRRGHELKLMGDTDEMIGALIADIDGAQLHCHVLFYIYLPDDTGRRVGEALGRAARRGVECRLLVDAVGSDTFLKSPPHNRLLADGVQVVRALPASLLRANLSRIDLRNHRKIAVIDGVIGYTGSQNIADASFAPKPKFAPWVDCMLRIRGPAVRDLQWIFVCDWYLDSEEHLERVLAIDPGEVEDGVTVQILATGPNSMTEALAQMTLAAFTLVREEIIITTPYFVPGDAEVTSLCTAARRGVRVVLVLPGRNDSALVGAVSRSHYEALVGAGVELMEYQKGLLHAKTVTADRNLALVTTANFDRRSFELNFEVSALVYDSDFASTLRFLQTSYIADSIRVDERALAKRSFFRRLVDNAAGVFSPLL